MVRVKYRYVIVRWWGDSGTPCVPQQVLRDIEEEIGVLYGVSGVGRVRHQLVMRWVGGDAFILRTPRADHLRVWAAVTMLDGLSTVATSGSLRGAAKRLEHWLTTAARTRAKDIRLGKVDASLEEVIATHAAQRDELRGLSGV
eukprot:Sspe_Gene.95529::Locus_67802_Transcript_1_1_Confidence_1.000_Length_625::g.95529::m.95529/K03537/POP5; ribonuclease P/MRP protein subunit POP5